MGMVGEICLTNAWSNIFENASFIAVLSQLIEHYQLATQRVRIDGKTWHITVEVGYTVGIGDVSVQVFTRSANSIVEG